jgi:hypothetical protein
MADQGSLILFHVREHFIHAFRNQVQSSLLQPLFDRTNAPSSTNTAGLQPSKPYDYENYPTTGVGNMLPNTNVTATNLREALMSTVSFFRYMRTFRYGLIGNDISWTSYANGFITDGYSWTLSSYDFPGYSNRVWTNNDTMLNDEIVRQIFSTMLGGVSGPAQSINYWESKYMHDRLATYVSKLATSGNYESDYPDLRVCHSSCHNSCHSSAPVVTPTQPPTAAPTQGPGTGGGDPGYLAPLNPGNFSVLGYSDNSNQSSADFELSSYGYISVAGSPISSNMDVGTWLPSGANAFDYELYWNYSGPALQTSWTSPGTWDMPSASGTLYNNGVGGAGVTTTCYFTIRHIYDHSKSVSFTATLTAKVAGTPTQAPTSPPGGGGGGGGGGCVSVHSFLPTGTVAGEIKVGESMFLADEDTLEHAMGEVTYSKTIEAEGYRIVTESGASLVCSDTAPIPVKGKGLVNPEGLLGEIIAVRHDLDTSFITEWEKVVAVEPVGRIKVQHITVGDRCFWAGEKKGSYILHHNYKQVPDYRDDQYYAY